MLLFERGWGPFNVSIAIHDNICIDFGVRSKHVTQNNQVYVGDSIFIHELESLTWKRKHQEDNCAHADNQNETTFVELKAIWATWFDWLHRNRHNAEIKGYDGVYYNQYDEEDVTAPFKVDSGRISFETSLDEGLILAGISVLQSPQT